MTMARVSYLIDVSDCIATLHVIDKEAYNIN